MDIIFSSFLNDYYIQVLTMLGIYIIAALGLNLITGVTGQLSFGHAAFISIGAYTAAIFSLRLNMPFGVALIAGGLMAAFWGILLGYPTLRLTGDYLGIATLGFGEIVRVVFLNMSITGGALGMAGIPRTTTLTIVVILVALVVWAMYRIENSRFGRSLIAIREDEIAAEAMGVNITTSKITAFAIGSFLAGLSGGLYAHLLQYLNPSDFGFSKSFEFLTFIVLGGLGSIPGVILGTTILALAPEFLRFIADYRMMVYGLLMVIMMIVRPRGLLGGVKLSRLFAKNKIEKTDSTAAGGSN
ncbi:branched-chain amino acid ABC transporter permease [Desulforamulus aquiferis]|uniref:Branched-chain amino acid ABC transporter permease n=1 Tax=Desulforamulus aquiferis TaxID=1397668 RepID=A0AAW7Z9G7_9FIRM|nr:branched-chain amino acid ABC transporter permease [Desulforamulus aquiferis]MDO7786170.1 branched-chain amino acid ABC transporter permease [Desulforamulus aquiferis]RYD04557.1 branched-chain amino acid ABC transporter permease [Desulforamulus aquiferis]